MFNKKWTRILTLSLAAVFLVLCFISLSPVRPVAAQTSATATPKLSCEAEWSAYDAAVLKKDAGEVINKRAAVVLCLESAKAQSAASPDTMPESIQVKKLLFRKWEKFKTTSETTSMISPANVAMAVNGNNMVFAVYTGGRWVNYPGMFTAQHDIASPLYAYQKDDLIHIAVYFTNSQSVLHIYHLSPDGTVPSYKPATLSFYFAEKVTVDNDGCFVGEQAPGTMALCPFLNESTGEISYITD